MTLYHEIRADFDEKTIVVYQAFCPQIADAAVKAQRFVPPFSVNRMTWIKPSFLWMMERSNWGLKPNQERILAVRITRAGWEEALSLAVLTHPDLAVYGDYDTWRASMDKAQVHVQWDPERNLRGGKLEHRSIQVGLSRNIVERYVNEWTTNIADITPRVRKIHTLMQQGKADAAERLLPLEQVYPFVSPNRAIHLKPSASP